MTVTAGQLVYYILLCFAVGFAARIAIRLGQLVLLERRRRRDDKLWQDRRSPPR